MSPDNSVSAWIAGLKGNEGIAAQKLWERYAIPLVDLARRKLGNAPKGIGDEEDIAHSVFRSVCRGAAAGRFSEVKCRDELWWLLLAITKQKVVDHVRRETAQKRGTGRVQSESALAADAKDSKGFTLDQLVGEEPTPDFLVMLEEENRRLLGLLRDDSLRKIAISRIEGYTVAEIAAELAVSTRSVERKLRLIRNKWVHDFSGIDSRI
jgi:DNA-directed RNA polymerase specialized sigma24 family protein